MKHLLKTALVLLLAVIGLQNACAGTFALSSSSPEDKGVLDSYFGYATMTFDLNFDENVVIKKSSSVAAHFYKGDAATGTEITPDDDWRLNIGDASTTARLWAADYDAYTMSFAVDDAATYTLVIPAGVIANAAGDTNEELTLTFYGSEEAKAAAEGGGETTALTLESSVPADGEQFTLSSGWAEMGIYLTFNKDITVAKSSADVVLQQVGGSAVEPDDSWIVTKNGTNGVHIWGSDYDGYVCTFKPAADATYTFTIPAGIVKDADGNLNEAITVNVLGPVTEKPSIVANFAADEAKTAYYEQGWDSQDDFDSWTYTSNNSTTWYLGSQPNLSGTKPFSSIDAASQNSLCIDYAYSAQDETATSPSITIRDNSTVDFYVCMYGVWLVYADLKLSVIDETAGTTTQLFSAFQWAQAEGFTGPSWLPFSYDLSAYAGHDVKFAFNYNGNGGDAMAVDGFKICQKDTSADATITINEGESVHFADATTGEPTAWNWTFEGGTPATSTDQNPVVAYEKAGSYSVTLTASNADASSTITRKGYVNVIAVAPTARIGVPAEGYLSPYVYCFVPVDTPVSFTDASTGKPDAWAWSFEGGTPATSFDQNPTVTYAEAGTYGVTLNVSNAAGSSDDMLVSAIQAGGKQEIWNIAPEEQDKLGGIALGWYGNYAGTNWLGMNTFAEEFAKPAMEAVIDTVTVYFNTTTCATDTTLTVTIRSKAENGEPGEVLGTATLSNSELQYDAQNVVPTYFTFDAPVTVKEAFFVCITGFPHNDGDDISILCVQRDDNEKCTAWHELADEDENYQYTGTYTWYKNSDSPLSMAICPLLQYQDKTSAISPSTLNDTEATVTARYSISGQAVPTSHKGVVIERMSNGKARKAIVR